MRDFSQILVGAIWGPDALGHAIDNPVEGPDAKPNLVIIERRVSPGMVHLELEWQRIDVDDWPDNQDDPPLTTMRGWLTIHATEWPEQQ